MFAAGKEVIDQGSQGAQGPYPPGEPSSDRGTCGSEAGLRPALGSLLDTRALLCSSRAGQASPRGCSLKDENGEARGDHVWLTGSLPGTIAASTAVDPSSERRLVRFPGRDSKGIRPRSSKPRAWEVCVRESCRMFHTAAPDPKPLEKPEAWGCGSFQV